MFAASCSDLDTVVSYKNSLAMSHLIVLFSFLMKHWEKNLKWYLGTLKLNIMIVMTYFMREKIEPTKINTAHLYPWPRKNASHHIKMEVTITGICLY